MYRFAGAARPGVVLDFDGTLSRIAPTPDAAVILPANRDALTSLAARFPLVAVVSGRAVRDVSQKVGVDGIVYVGNHGAEYMIHRQVKLAPGAAVIRSTVARVLDHIEQTVALPGLVFEDKVFSTSVHFRLARDPAQAVRALEVALGSAPGMTEIDPFWGRMVLELRPVNAPNKGDAVAALADEHSLDSALFVGDDTTDVDAMTRLKKHSGLAGVAVAVLSEETPQAVLDAADYSLNGVEEVGELLRMLRRFRPAG